MMKTRMIWLIIVFAILVKFTNAYLVDVDFNVTVEYYDGLDNCSVYTNSTGDFAIEGSNTSAIVNDTETNLITVTLDAFSSYLWNTECCYEGICNFADDNYTFSFETLIRLDLNFTPTWTDGIDNCSVYTNKTEWSLKKLFLESDLTNNTVSNYTDYYPVGDYLWNVKCCYEGICDYGSEDNYTFRITTEQNSCIYSGFGDWIISDNCTGGNALSGDYDLLGNNIIIQDVYVEVASDGHIFNFSSLQNQGSLINEGAIN